MMQYYSIGMGLAVFVGLMTLCLGGINAQASSKKSNNNAPTVATAKTAKAATIGELDHSTQNVERGKESGHTLRWSYEGGQGSANWGHLSADYSLCGDGAMQSPINFGDTFGAGGATISFDYHVTPLTLLQNGHTVQLNYEPGSGINVDGKRFELLQLHFHAPSEHAVGSEQTAMEMHLVHKNAEGQLAVVGVLMNIGRTNRALSELWAHMPQSATEAQTAIGTLVNARDLLPAGHSYYRYMGSLTTPPCSEGVNWLVLDTPITVGIEQVKRFADSVGFDARPLQPKSQRLVIAPIKSN